MSSADKDIEERKVFCSEASGREYSMKRASGKIIRQIIRPVKRSALSTTRTATKIASPPNRLRWRADGHLVSHCMISVRRRHLRESHSRGQSRILQTSE